MVAGLVFVGWEVRQNRQTLRATAIQESTNVVRQQVQMFVMDADVNRINMIGGDDPSQLNEEDAARYRWIAISSWWGLEGLYRQWKLGVLPDEEWDAWNRVACGNIAVPGHRALWDDLILIAEFRSVVEECETFRAA